MRDVLTFTDKGIYCPAGDFFIDPWRPVKRALITHGHADHARWGHESYLCTAPAAPVIERRLGVTPQTVDYGRTLTIGDASVSFHPAGHVPGSAQIRVEVGGQIWVVSGDYKVEEDGLSEPFEPVPCHAFITECTFGLPVFNWTSQAELAGELNAWWRACRDAGKVAVIGAYSLGKAQRVLTSLDLSIGPVFTHGAVENMNSVLREQGVDLPPTTQVTPDVARAAFAGGLVIAPPSAMDGNWMRRFGPVSRGYASGWMALRGVRRRRAADRGFVMSDHADWNGLNEAVAATGAERVFVTHGYTGPFRKWLQSRGYDAHVVSTEYEGESLDTAPGGDEAGEGA